MNPPRLLYISDVAPGPGGGGAIIAQRHLTRLAADGWAITVVTACADSALAGRYPDWKCVAVPARRWWWPPFNPARPALTRLRTALSRRALARVGVTRADADVIVTICWGTTSWLAASLARSWQRPLVAIVHDWWAEGGTAGDARIGKRVCETAQNILVVSEEMRAAFAGFGREKVEVLYPLPEERSLPFVVWRDEFARAPAVAHVGTLHPYHVAYLADLAARLAPLGGRLLVVCPADNPVLATLRARTSNLEHHDFFSSNLDALRWISARACAFTVMYAVSTGAPGSPPTGFPSRLVEFAQLGLPVLLVAPAANPVRAWAVRGNWTAQFDPGDGDTADRLLAALTRRDDWEKLSAETRTAAQGDFDPLRLHMQFATILQRLATA